MFTKNRKGLKKIAVCLACTSLVLQTHAMQELKEEYNIIGVALFSGADFVSNFVKYSTHSSTSHVGIILSDQKDENKWYCFESTGSEQEVRSGVYPHVRLTPWDEIVNDYEGDVSYRLFVFKDRERTNSNMVTNFVEKYDGKSYTKNPLKLLGALLNMNRTSKSEVSRTVFCSELAAKMFMEFEILDEGIESNCLPRDFTYEIELAGQSRISLKSGVELTPAFIEKLNKR